MIILVRHGRTELNRSRCLQGRVDATLDEVGEQQADTVGTYLASELQVSRIISSPLQRAQQTASRIAQQFEIGSVDIDERWIEIDYGIYD